MARRVVFGVRCFPRRRGRLEQGAVYEYATEARAAWAAHRLSRTVPDLVIFRVEGDPQLELWDEPEVLATYGDVPEVA